MSKKIFTIFFVLTMVAIIISADVLFFKNHLWERLLANIGIVLVFVAFYFRFLKNP